LVIAAVGVATAFVVDAISFLGVIYVIFKWKRPVQKSTLPTETIAEASWAAIRYVRYSPAIRTLLLRSGIVIFFSSSFWALLPAVAKQLSNSPYGYGFMLGAFGIGAVLGAVVLQRARAKFSTEAVLSAATVVFGAVLLSTALLHNLEILCGLMLLGGAAWTVFMSLFNTIIQKLAPDWIRARVLASYLFVFQGSVALGSTLWGFAAQRTSLRWALFASAAGIGLSLFLQFPFKLPSAPVDLSPWNNGGKPQVFPQQFAGDAGELGPVLVTVRYVIDPVKAADFLNEVYKYQRVRRRDGATRWGIYYDVESPNTYVETFLVDSVAEHERQHDHFTVADHELEKRVWSYTVEPVTAKHFIYADKTNRS
jgi:hypothetical protein